MNRFTKIKYTLMVKILQYSTFYEIFVFMKSIRKEQLTILRKIKLFQHFHDLFVIMKTLFNAIPMNPKNLTYENLTISKSIYSSLLNNLQDLVLVFYKNEKNNKYKSKPVFTKYHFRLDFNLNGNYCYFYEFFNLIWSIQSQLIRMFESTINYDSFVFKFPTRHIITKSQFRRLFLSYTSQLPLKSNLLMKLDMLINSNS